MKKIIVLLLIFGFCYGPIMAQIKYADAHITKGTLTVVRDGEVTIFESGGEDIEIQEGDIIRVGLFSAVTLKTVEETNVMFGSNAVMHIRPWRVKGRTGTLRMLFGKLRYKTAKLRKKRRFRIRTAMAVMGVKGSEGIVDADSVGNTTSTQYESEAEFISVNAPEIELVAASPKIFGAGIGEVRASFDSGSYSLGTRNGTILSAGVSSVVVPISLIHLVMASGRAVANVSPGTTSAVVNGGATSVPIETPEELKDALLDNLLPNDPNSKLTGLVELVSLGAVDQADYNSSQSEKISDAEVKEFAKAFKKVKKRVSTKVKKQALKNVLEAIDRNDIVNASQKSGDINISIEK